MNPFNDITPNDNELMINEEIINKISNKIRENISKRRIIIIEGDYGSGKTLYLKRLYKRLRTKKELINFDNTIINKLSTTKAENNKSLFIDDFDLIIGFSDKEVLMITQSLINLTNNGLIIIIACRKETIRLLFHTNPLIISRTQRIRIPRLTYKEAEELIIKRLNNKNNDLSPFTKKEVRMIWRKANGNPRMILLLLKHLYDERVNE